MNGGADSTAGANGERALIEACQRGEQEMFRPLVEKYRQRTFLLALQLVGNREDALDISQESFIRVYQTLERFDTSRPFGAWLLRIVRNLSIDLLRRRKVRRHVSLNGTRSGKRAEDAEGPALSETLSDPVAVSAQVLVERNELREQIWRAMGQLSPSHREILVLRDFQDLSYREIADVLEIPRGTVMSRLHQARQRLRALLEDVID